MTAARSQLVDVNVTRYYHCILRCVRKTVLCGEGFEHRKQWIEDRLQTLSECFAASVCGFAVMDNHLHVLVRLESDAANGWSAEDVVRRWLVAHPPKSADGQAIEVTQVWINDLAGDEQRLAARLPQSTAHADRTTRVPHRIASARRHSSPGTLDTP